MGRPNTDWHPMRVNNGQMSESHCSKQVVCTPDSATLGVGCWGVSHRVKRCKVL